MPEDDTPTVLVVDDEESVAEAYALWLSEEYDVRTAHDGQEAIEEMDDDVDVVLLDRRMPRMSGDEALAAIRERGYDARVAMVTAVDPDLDIVEMPFDDYLTKPVTRGELTETVEELLTLNEYDEAVSEEFALAQKQAALEANADEAALADDEDYQELKERRAELQDQVTDSVGEMDEETFEAALSDLPGEDEEA